MSGAAFESSGPINGRGLSTSGDLTPPAKSFDLATLLTAEGGLSASAAAALLGLTVDNAAVTARPGEDVPAVQETDAAPVEEGGRLQRVARLALRYAAQMATGLSEDIALAVGDAMDRVNEHDRWVQQKWNYVHNDAPSLMHPIRRRDVITWRRWQLMTGRVTYLDLERASQQGTRVVDTEPLPHGILYGLFGKGGIRRWSR